MKGSCGCFSSSAHFFKTHEESLLSLQPFLFCQFKKKHWSMVKEYALGTGHLPLGGLSRNSVARITDHPVMTLAVDHGCKALNSIQLT